MKFSCTALFVLVSAIIRQPNPASGHRYVRAKPSITASSIQWSFHAKKTSHEGKTRYLVDESYGQFYSDASCLGVSCNDGPICIELKNEDPSDDAKLTIGNCNGGPGWRIDSKGLIHSEADDNHCMQAGREGNPKDGNMIRMFRCDSNNELQKFVYEGFQLIKPVSDESLCVVWQGNTPNLGDDDVVLKKCNKVTERAAWSGDLPVDSPDDPVDEGCAIYQTTVVARSHQGNDSSDPDTILEGNVDANYVTQVKSTDALFDGYNTLGYTNCNAASYLNFPSSPDIFGGDERDEWGITCTTILLNKNKSNGSMSQLVATGLPGGLFKALENSSFSDVGMPIVGGSGPFRGAVGTITIGTEEISPDEDACEVGFCVALTWKVELCGVTI